jgi:hypothetical protein
MRTRRWMVVATLATMLGCNAIFGIEPGQLAEGGAGGTGATGASGGSGGAPQGGGPNGGGGSCTENDMQPCFDDDPSKAEVGECARGEQGCEGGVFGECVGQVLPTTEDCNDPGDEDCDGNACSDVVWVKQLSATQQVFAIAFGVSDDGSILVGGSFEGTLDLGGTVVTSGGPSVFASVLEANGDVRWANELPFRGFGWAGFGSQGRVVVSSTFDQPLTFGGNTFAPLGTDIVVAALDSQTGVPITAGRIGGPGEDNARVSVFPNGDLLLVGETDLGIDFGGSVGTLAPTVAASGAFVVRLTPQLTPVWGRMIEYDVPGDTTAPKVVASIQGDQVAVATNYRARLVGPGCSFFGSNTSNLALTLVGADGTIEWAACAFGDVDPHGVSVAPDGSPVVLMMLSASTQLNPAVGPTINATPTGLPDLYLWKLGPNGATAWSKRYGDDQYQGLDEGAILALDHDSNGRLVVADAFQGTMDFGTGSVLQSEGEYDAFLATILPNGDTAWARSMGGPGPVQAFFSVTTAPTTNEIVGSVIAAADIDFGDGTVYTPASGIGLDSFIVKFQP